MREGVGGEWSSSRVIKLLMLFGHIFNNFQEVSLKLAYFRNFWISTLFLPQLEKKFPILNGFAGRILWILSFVADVYCFKFLLSFWKVLESSLRFIICLRPFRDKNKVAWGKGREASGDKFYGSTIPYVFVAGHYDISFSSRTLLSTRCRKQWSRGEKDT